MIEDEPDGEPFLVEQADGIKHPSRTHARAFLGLLRAAEALDRGLDLDLKAAHGLSLRDFEVLLHLAAFSPSGSLRMAQLTAQAPLSQSRVSRLVGGLEDRGLVERARDQDDSRGVLVTITERGLNVLRQAQDTHYAGLRQRLFAHLRWTDVAALAQLADTILAANGGAGVLPPMPGATGGRCDQLKMSRVHAGQGVQRPQRSGDERPAP